MADVLRAILKGTERIVAERRAREPDTHLESRALARQPRGAAFRAALSVPDRVNVIAECKRRSPSRGVLRPMYDASAIAQGYARAGAAAVSVLTEGTFFDGALEHLEAVRAAVTMPVLRKDFTIDRYQLLEARACGADAVLLIVAALDDETLRRLLEDARALGLAALVEVHDLVEVDRALSAGADIIGVNNRNLKTLAVDVRMSEAAATRIPRHVVAVSESGLRTAEDIGRLRALGYTAFLIGERFMTTPDPGQALHELLAGAGAPVPLPVEGGK